MKKKKRIEDQNVLNKYRKASCIICGRASDPAHVRTRGSGGDDVDQNVIALCREHHTMQGAIGWHRFSKKFPVVYLELMKKGWVIELEFGIYKLRRID